MKLCYIFIIAVASIFASCNSHSRQYDEIDMEKAFNDSQMEDGATLYRDIELIELDYTRDVLLGPLPSIETIIDNDIVIRNNNDIYHYSREGKYLNRIGRYGNGHAEYGQILSVSCDTINREVYVSTLASEVYIYTFEGKFVRNYKMRTDDNEKIKSTCYSHSHGLMVELQQCNGTEYNVLVATLNVDGDIINRELIYSDNLEFPISRESTSEMYPYGDGVKVKLEYSGILFCVGDDKHSPVELTYGKQIPDRRMIEDASMKNILMNEYVQILDVKESYKYLYFVLYKKRNMRCAVYDKQSKTFVFSQNGLNPKLGEGIILQNIDKRFWPTWTCGNLSASIILPDYNDGYEIDGTHDNYKGASIIVAHE